MSDKIDWPSIAAHHLLERDKPLVLQFNAVRGNQSKDDVSRSNVNLLARKLFATCFGSVHVQRRWLVRRESLGPCPVRLQCFSDKFGHSNCVILRDSREVPDLQFPL